MKYSKNVQKRRCFEGIHDTIEMLRQFLYIYSTVKHNKYVTTCSILLVCMLGTHYDRTRFQIRDCRYQTLTITLTLTLENSTQKPCCDNFLVPTWNWVSHDLWRQVLQCLCCRFRTCCDSMVTLFPAGVKDKLSITHGRCCDIFLFLYVKVMYYMFVTTHSIVIVCM